MRSKSIVISGMVLGLATVGYSQVDVVSVASESGLDILFGGEVEMEFVDV